MTLDVEELTHKDYNFVRRLVYAKSGINLGDQKMQLVKARLGKYVRKGGYASFRDYLEHVEQDPTGEELSRLLDAISTNTTHLFRESQHFDFLRQLLDDWASTESWRKKNDSVRIWSAGCSSGEEPYSIVMLAHDVLQNHPSLQLKILATDLSTQMLSRAKLGLFNVDAMATVPPKFKTRYLRKVVDDDKPKMQVVDELRKFLTFSRFNLMTPKFPFKYGFNVIFCRNVMIYFDKPTQQGLVKRFADALRPGGYLMIGHSESLSSIEHGLTYVKPTVYRKD